MANMQHAIKQKANQKQKIITRLRPNCTKSRYKGTTQPQYLREACSCTQDPRSLSLHCSADHTVCASQLRHQQVYRLPRGTHPKPSSSLSAKATTAFHHKRHQPVRRAWVPFVLLTLSYAARHAIPARSGETGCSVASGTLPNSDINELQ